MRKVISGEFEGGRCHYCGYSLKGLEKQGKCPECGVQVHAARVKESSNSLEIPL